ncbi:MAG: tRNA (guanosine(46)-N7)-methyltransferase TrmB [Alphaproteobacteria bacterium]
MPATPCSTPRFYGRRKGRTLRQKAQAAFETGLPSLTFNPAEDFFASHHSARLLVEPLLGSRGAGAHGAQNRNVLEVHEDLSTGATHPSAHQRESDKKSTEAWLEIGFGSGEHLLAQLKEHPAFLFLGCEAYKNGVAAFIKELPLEDHPRVRLFSSDVRTCLPTIPPATFSRTFVLFPDPWPKKRHHKRRLLQPAFLDQLARVLKDQGEVRVASDDLAYVEWIQDVFQQHPDFEKKMIITASSPETWPETWPRTRYGNKALEQGKSCTFMIFKKQLAVEADL